ncbi:MAG: hypothetical protein IPP11_14505 [Chitinophagaceae bacterium]|nr:hypothetical protein [Chitinophagaceae bacterium]
MKKLLPLVFVMIYPFFNEGIFAQANTETTQAANETAKCFVEYNDGSIKEFQKLELVTAMFKSPRLIANGNIIIKPEEIKAYNDSKGRYAISAKLFEDAKETYVATAALNGFAYRIVKGKINVFALKYYNGRVTALKYYLQQGDNKSIQPYSAETLAAMIKDDAGAAQFCNNNEPDKNAGKFLTSVVEIYNSNAQSVTAGN